ncbi:MAG TPA: CoA transferase [Dehalococcoidia bacterium]|nr:CoA transferase [Dehalococcoidia bacterium]
MNGETSRVLRPTYDLPLAGLRILDLTMVWAGPAATRLLADAGAEVIKVESARSWDMLRSLHFLGGQTAQWWDKAAYFNHNNRNKYACTLDLQTERGRELALRLAAISDVVFENYRADVLGKLRLDYDDLRRVKDDIILVSMPSHGKSGPEAHHVAYGTNVEQLAGLVSVTGYPGMGPHKSPIAYGDPNAGAMAAAAALAALHHRQRTGEGQHVEVAQWEAMIGNIGEFVLAHQMDGGSGESPGNRHVSRIQGVYPCAGEDAWVAISVGADAEFAALWGAIGRGELAGDARFGDVVSRRRNHDELDAIIGAWTGDRTQDEAAQALQAAGVAAAPVLRIPRLMANEHLRARGFWESVSHAAAGTWDMEGPVWRMSRTPAHVRVPPPMFGEHNQWVLGGLLGLSETEIAELEAAGITAREPDQRVHA